jgi:hypothetical protein
MTRSTARASRKPKGARDAQARATLVFRDFVRQLEKLGARPQKTVREGSRSWSPKSRPSSSNSWPSR